MILPIKDIHGNDIKDGDEVIYNEDRFIAMYIGKDNVEWVLHPCGSNQSDTALDITSIPTPMDSGGIKLELVKN